MLDILKLSAREILGDFIKARWIFDKYWRKLSRVCQGVAVDRWETTVALIGISHRIIPFLGFNLSVPSYEMVLRYAHLAPDHLSHAAARIERVLEIVEPNSTKTLRFSGEQTHE